MTTIPIQEYVRSASQTDRFELENFQPIVLGLFGEVGGVMSAVKKHKREGEVFFGYRNVVVEELGDVLWYFAALAARCNIDLDSVFLQATRNGKYGTIIAANDIIPAGIAQVSSVAALPGLDQTLVRLGETAANLLSIATSAPESERRLVEFADAFLHVLQGASVSLAEVMENNLKKVRGRFLLADPATLPDFDSKFSPDEQLPRSFEIAIRQRRGGQSFLEWNGVFIGDPLTDNIGDRDGYRFHDVFHFAHASVLHWSPTFRALIKHKRKSDPNTDETQDSGRAIVVEEGLSAWIFAKAKLLGFFEGQKGVSFDLLKTVSEFVRGYEVDTCPLKLWEDAILQGYSVFRQVKANNGGLIVCDRTTRRIEYKPLKEAP
jgi:NTP pyrophosphatase (non-canonical NTP hydrolase)